MERKGIDPNRIVLIPNWSPDPRGSELRPEKRFRREHGLGETFVVLYSGNMGIPHEFDTILEVANRLEEESALLFLFVGQGMQRDHVAAISESAPNVRLLPYQPLNILGAMLAEADVHYVSLKPAYCGMIVPSKFYGALASGRPIIFEGPAESELARVIKETQGGVVVGSGEVEALENAIRRYSNKPPLADRDGQAGRKAYFEKFTAESARARYVHLIQDLLAKPKHGHRTNG